MGDWVYLYDEASGLHYYANVCTGITQWEVPTDLCAGTAVHAPEPAAQHAAAQAADEQPATAAPHDAPSEAACVAANVPESEAQAAAGESELQPDGGEWVEYMDAESETMYYFNEQTQESCWEQPPGARVVAPSQAVEDGSYEASADASYAQSAEGEGYASSDDDAPPLLPGERSIETNDRASRIDR